MLNSPELKDRSASEFDPYFSFYYYLSGRLEVRTPEHGTSVLQKLTNHKRLLSRVPDRSIEVVPLPVDSF
jgi:hypothetical protein